MITKREHVRPLQRTERRTRCSIVDPVNRFWIPTFTLRYPERLDPERLRTALAQVLSDFGSMAGRLVRDRGDWYIEHGFGCVFETAESAESSRALCLAARNTNMKLVSPRVSPISGMFTKAPLFAARVTLTPDGSVLGLTWNHALGDFVSMLSLLRAWALAYRGESYEKEVEVEDRDAYLSEHARTRPSDETNTAPRSTGPEWRMDSWPDFLSQIYPNVRMLRAARRVVVDYSWDQLSKIRAAATNHGSAISLGDALCAHVFWTLQMPDQNVDRNHFLTVNFRKQLGLPSNLSGNFSDLVRTVVNPEDGPAEIASALRTSIETLDADSLTAHALKRLKAAHGRLSVLRVRPPGEPGRMQLGLANVSRAGHNRVIFESSRPTFIHTWPGLDWVGVGSVLPSPDAGGLTVDMFLPPMMADRLVRASS